MKYGGREEYDAVVKFHDEAKTPSMRIAAMYVSRARRRLGWLTEVLVWAAGTRWARRRTRCCKMRRCGS